MTTDPKGLAEPMTPIERVRCALAMSDAGYSWSVEIEDVEVLLKEYDRLSEPHAGAVASERLCDDCPEIGYPTDKTRCLPCPRRPDIRLNDALGRWEVWRDNTLVSTHSSMKDAEAVAAEDHRYATPPAAQPQEWDRDNGDRAVIENGAVVIRFPIDAMQSALEGAWAMNKLEQRYRITNEVEFVKEFVNSLNSEDEQGTTLVHQMADKAFLDCIEQGAFGIDLHEEQKA